MSRRGMLIAGTVAVAAVISVGVFVALGAPGGGGSGEEPVPEALRGLGPPTFEIGPPPAPVTPTPAAQAGRDDCPQDWAAYQDPDGRFSLCYPADWTATSNHPQAYFGHTLSVRSPAPLGRQGGVELIIYWSEPSPFVDPGSVRAVCDAVIPEDWPNMQEVSLTLAGRAVAACVSDTSLEDGGPSRGTYAEIPLGTGEGRINLFLFETGTLSASNAAAPILETLRVEQ